MPASTVRFAVLAGIVAAQTLLIGLYAPRTLRALERVAWLIAEAEGVMGWLRYGLVVGVALLVMIAGAVALYRASQSQYFVGVSNDHVAIYRGVDADLPFISLNSVAERTDISLSELSSVNRDSVIEGIEARDRADADATVARLRATRIKPQPKPTVTPSTTPTTTATATATTPATP